MNRCKCPSCGHEWDQDQKIGTVEDNSPEGLAQLWCFHLTRRKFGAARDLPSDITPEMANLIQLGIHSARIRTEILRKGRDRGEYMWQFKQRFGLGFALKKAPLPPGPVFEQVRYERPTKETLESIDKGKELWRKLRGIGEMPEESS